ncbi:MAG: hypothetical protein GTO63_18110 [Anaerolineae bacterium]|nr:hypothetical protein [Anaerolineae bacterium]NIN98708.1 hypothetical protein [Anaerolineae bacterium]NIQ81598.1 hypothetical protein [Anaerolineae bacterium]
MRRLAFVTGFALGLAGFVLVAGNVVLYLLTGKLPSVEVREDGRPALGLATPAQIVTMVKEQVDRERERYVGVESEIGEPYQEGSGDDVE